VGREEGGSKRIIVGGWEPGGMERGSDGGREGEERGGTKGRRDGGTENERERAGEGAGERRGLRLLRLKRQCRGGAAVSGAYAAVAEATPVAAVAAGRLGGAAAVAARGGRQLLRLGRLRLGQEQPRLLLHGSCWFAAAAPSRELLLRLRRGINCVVGTAIRMTFLR
jgi:hypothetical protein